MITHFKISFIKHVILVACLLFFTVDLMADTDSAEKVFDRNKSRILKHKALAVEGFVFSTGKCVSRASTRQIGFSKARIKAYGNIPFFIFQKISWPESLAESLQKRIFNDYLNLSKIKMTIENAQRVFSSRNGQTYIVVMAIREKKIKTHIPTFTKLKTTLLDPRNFNNPALRISLVLELAGKNYNKMILNAYARKLSRKYGINVGKVVSGEFAENFSLITAYQINSMKTLNAFKLSELFLLLDKAPYHPRLCWEIAKRMDKQAMPFNAKLFRERGIMVGELNLKYAQKCRQVESPDFLYPKQFCSKLNLQPFRNAVAKALFKEGALKILKKAGGRIFAGTKKAPEDESYLKGMKLYHANKLSEAYLEFKKSVITNLSFSGCNMAGNVARRVNKPYEAIAFLLQAIIIDDSKDYPWIHLAFVFKELKQTKLLKYCIKKAENYTQRSSWSIAQITLLKKYLKSQLSQ